MRGHDLIDYGNAHGVKSNENVKYVINMYGIDMKEHIAIPAIAILFLFDFSPIIPQIKPAKVIQRTER